MLKGADFQRFVMEDMDGSEYATNGERKRAAKIISEQMLCRDEALGRFSAELLLNARKHSVTVSNTK